MKSEEFKGRHQKYGFDIFHATFFFPFVGLREYLIKLPFYSYLPIQFQVNPAEKFNSYTTLGTPIPLPATLVIDGTLFTILKLLELQIFVL